nr:MAG TPA: hypothetical protein [Caudoviricetes sp.]
MAETIDEAMASDAASRIEGTIRLRRPLLVNGEERSEFRYDLSRITAAQFSAAEAAARKSADFHTSVCETDYAFHLQIGFFACIAVDSSLDISDMQRVTGTDLKKFMEVGRFFMSASDESDPPTSDAPQGSTQGATRPQSPTSTDGPSQDSSPNTARPPKSPGKSSNE